MEKKIVALGFFDGVHRGHQALLRACREMAAQTGCETAAITFDRHPQSLFTAHPPKLINTLADRERLLRQYGIARILVIPVTAQTMGMPWDAFLDTLVAQGAAGFVCGDDFRFGHRGAGTADALRGYCADRKLPCAVVQPQLVDQIRVSSTAIRAMLEAGEMERAVRFLGHPHILTGEVVHGRGLGHTIGIPTANLLLPENVLQPCFGVYACRAQLEGQTYSAVTNIGTRPTVGGHRVTVEPWLLDFNRDIYAKQLVLEFYAFLRPERKFESLQALKAEIEKNAAQTREIFGNN